MILHIEVSNKPKQTLMRNYESLIVEFIQNSLLFRISKEAFATYKQPVASTYTYILRSSCVLNQEVAIDSLNCKHLKLVE